MNAASHLHATILPAKFAVPNRWDLVAFPLIFSVLVLLAFGAKGTFAPLDKTAPISLDPVMLPGYAVRTVLRMFAAMAASILFTLTYATLVAKSRRAEIILIPVLDVLQSVPILGYISYTAAFASACSFSVGAGLPLIVTFFAPEIQAAAASVDNFASGETPLLDTLTSPEACLLVALSLSSLLFLALLGAVAARVGGASMWPAALRVTFLGRSGNGRYGGRWSLVRNNCVIATEYLVTSQQAVLIQPKVYR